MNPNQYGSEKHHKSQSFCQFCGGLGILEQITLSCKLQIKHPNKKSPCQKHKILWNLSMN